MRHLLLKDLRILRRSPLMVALLVAYPVLIALLVGLALSKGPDKPRVAVLDELPPGGASTITIGGARIDPRDYAAQLSRSVDEVPVHSRAEAVDAVRRGDVLAAIVIPPDLVERIRQTLAMTGSRQRPTVEVLYNAEDPVKERFVRSTIEARIAELNRAAATKLTQVAAGYLDILLRGGRFSLLGQQLDILGLQRSKALLDSVLTRTPRGSPDHRALQRVSSFAGLAIDNLDLSGPVLRSIATPIAVKRTVVDGRRTPLDAYAVSVAVTLSLMLVGLLLAAGMLALEREEHALGRLVRGLVSRTGVVVEKALLGAVCAGGAALAMTAAISLFVPLDRGRAGLWLVALAAAGLAFGAMGTAIGALAREVRAASLLAILLGLPIAFLALVPSGAVSGGVLDALHGVSALFPFRASLDAVDAALNGAGGLGGALAHLAALVAGWGLLARAALQRLG